MLGVCKDRIEAFSAVNVINGVVGGGDEWLFWYRQRSMTPLKCAAKGGKGGREARIGV